MDKGPFVLLCAPHVGGNEWEYVKDCLDTHWVSSVGAWVDRFERELGEVAGASHCVAVNAGTSALHLALMLSGVERETEVVMPAVSFVAPANAVRYCGAWPVFIDLDPATWQIDLDKLEDFLTTVCARDSSGELINSVTGRRVSALLAGYVLGAIFDVVLVAELVRLFELPLVEDAAECLGATCRGRPIGAPVPGHDPARRTVATSFNGNKIVTTGGGGALFSEDEALARRAKHLSTTAKTDAIEFHHDEVGYNYRLSNVSAAIGVAQLELLDAYAERKRAIAARYERAFAPLEPIETGPRLDYCESTWWMYTIRVDRPSRDLIRELNDRNLQTRPLWIPLPDLPAFADCYGHAIEFAPLFYDTALSIPCSVSLTEDDQQRVIRALEAWCAAR